MVGLKTLVLVLIVLVALAVVATPGGIDRVSGVFDEFKTWFGINIGGMIPKSVAGSKAVALTLSPPAPYLLQPSDKLNITSGSVHINGFSGDIFISKSEVSLEETSTGLNLTLPANGTALSGLKIDSMTFDGIGFYISPNITTTGGNLSILGFSGSGSIDSGRLTLEGNVSSLRATVGTVNVEI